MSQTDLAKEMRTTISRINNLINGKHSVTAKTALLLSEIFKNSPEFWMNLQNAYDFYKARLEAVAAQGKAKK